MHGALGPHFSTPLYRNNTRTGKTRTTVNLPGKAIHVQRLRQRIEALTQRSVTSCDAGGMPLPTSYEPVPGDKWEDVEDSRMSVDSASLTSVQLNLHSEEPAGVAGYDILGSANENDDDETGPEDPTTPSTMPKLKRNRQNDAERMNNSWRALLLSLQDPLLAFINHSTGCYSPSVDTPWLTSCTDICCPQKTRVLCLEWDREWFSFLSLFTITHRVSILNI